MKKLKIMLVLALLALSNNSSFASSLPEDQDNSPRALIAEASCLYGFDDKEKTKQWYDELQDNDRNIVDRLCKVLISEQLDEAMDVKKRLRPIYTEREKHQFNFSAKFINLLDLLKPEQAGLVFQQMFNTAPAGYKENPSEWLCLLQDYLTQLPAQEMNSGDIISTMKFLNNHETVGFNNRRLIYFKVLRGLMDSLKEGEQITTA